MLSQASDKCVALDLDYAAPNGKTRSTRYFPLCRILAFIVSWTDEIGTHSDHLSSTGLALISNICSLPKRNWSFTLMPDPRNGLTQYDDK